MLARERDRRRFALVDDGGFAVRHPIRRIYCLWRHGAVLIGDPRRGEEMSLIELHGGMYMKYARLLIIKYTISLPFLQKQELQDLYLQYDLTI